MTFTTKVYFFYFFIVSVTNYLWPFWVVVHRGYGGLYKTAFTCIEKAMHTRTGVVMCSPWIAKRHKAALLMQEPIISERLLASVGNVGCSSTNVKITVRTRSRCTVVTDNTSCYQCQEESLLPVPPVLQTPAKKTSAKGHQKDFMFFDPHNKFLNFQKAVADPGFPIRRGANLQGGGANLFFGQIFPKNCMKIKEFGPR